ncbi:MAG: Bug family tripartite tricarboxylate transporter substrate binding protein, partial [Acidobacteriota bacterium]
GPPAMPLVKGGKTRALAVTGAERSPELPNVPSMAEAGFPSVNVKLWSGFFAPAGTPAPIVKKLEAALSRALADGVVKQRLSAMAVSPGGPTGDAFTKLIDGEITSYADIVKAAKLSFPE